LARLSIFLITVALIAGMVGCDQYILTIYSTKGGQVTTPVEVTSTYGNGTVVDLVATPDAGYRFDRWTPDVGTIANVSAAETTITMNSSYTITAKFVKGKEIRDWNDLDDIRDDLGGSHILMNDLDSTTAGYEELASPTADGGKGWQPIVTFNGTFDGRGYKIRDLYINRPDATGVGLFGYVDKVGVVQNVTVVNANVTGNSKVGGLVGWNEGKVENSYSSSSVTGGNQYVGGLVGWNQGTVSKSYSSSSVTGSNKYVGGLAGWNQGTVSDCYSTGSVTGNSSVGGLVGYNDREYYVGTVSNSTSTGSVSGNSSVGGLVGWNEGKVENSYSSSNVTGSDEHVGGLVGWNQGTVGNSYSTGNVKGNDNVGGLVGFNNRNGAIGNNSYSTGNVTSEEGSYVGGLVGWNEGKVNDSYSSSNVSGRLCVGGLVGENMDAVEKSYSTGSVSGDTYIGGLVGQNDKTVIESYSTGNVKGSKRVGGLVGYNKGGTVQNSTVENSYSAGNVTGDQYVGGLVGYNEGQRASVSKSYSTGSVTGYGGIGGLVGRNNNGKVSNSFWDKETSGMGVSDGGTRKATAEMQDINTFSGADWDIVPVGSPSQRSTAHIWNIVDNVTYPFLSWQSVS
jgi:hypothetical protein